MVSTTRRTGTTVHLRCLVPGIEDLTKLTHFFSLRKRGGALVVDRATPTILDGGLDIELTPEDTFEPGIHHYEFRSVLDGRVYSLAEGVLVLTNGTIKEALI